jgi:hypothetical protein
MGRQPEFIILAGISVQRTDVEWLAWGVCEPTATRLFNALKNRRQVVGLEEEDELALLAVLEDAPVGLEALRGALMQNNRLRRS